MHDWKLQDYPDIPVWDENMDLVGTRVKVSDIFICSRCNQVAFCSRGMTPSTDEFGSYNEHLEDCDLVVTEMVLGS